MAPSASGSAIQSPGVAQVAVVGLGLIGGSVARRLRLLHPQVRLTGYSLNPEDTDAALAAGVLDAVGEDAVSAAAGADLVVLATPPQSIAALAADICAAHAQVLVTDTGSVKRVVVEGVRHLPPEQRCRIVPAHPVAGTEHSGFAASSDTLLGNCAVVLTPVPEPEPEPDGDYINNGDKPEPEPEPDGDYINGDYINKNNSLDLQLEPDGDYISNDYINNERRVEAFWRSLGTEVARMDAKAHDASFAATSHLPHLVAWALAASVHSADSTEQSFGGGGLKSLVRVAASDPQLWAQVATLNGDALSSCMRNFSQFWQALTALVEAGDEEELRLWLQSHRFDPDSYK